MDDTQRPSRSDRIGLYFSVAIAVVIVVLAGVSAVTRLIEVAPGHDIPVTVPLSDVAVNIPLGPDGAPYPATVVSATIEVADPAPATLFALWGEPIVIFACVAALMVVISLFMVRLARGEIFAAGTYRLVYWAAGVLAAQILVGGTFTNMTTNGALSAVSDYTYDSVIFEQDLTPLLWFLLLGGIGAALQIGERMRRDTEGLV